MTKLTDPATKPFTKVTVCGEAPSTNAVRWLSIAQQMQAAVINKPAAIPADPSPAEVTIPAMMVRITPIHAGLSSESRKNMTPKMAVATSSMFNQMETDAALAVFKPASRSTGPRKPPKKMMPAVFIPAPLTNNNFRLFPFLNK